MDYTSDFLFQEILITGIFIILGLFENLSIYP